MACFLSGIHHPKKLQEGPLNGRYFENFVFQQLLSIASQQIIRPHIQYWKLKRSGFEVDFIYRQMDKVIPIEVKSSTNVTFMDTVSLRAFLKEHPESQVGVLVYTGKKVFHVASNIIAVPLLAL